MILASLSMFLDLQRLTCGATLLLPRPHAGEGSIGRLMPADFLSRLALAPLTTSDLRWCRVQKTIELPPFKRGCHVITRNLLQQLPELGDIEVGLANFFSTAPFIPGITMSVTRYFGTRTS